MEREERRYRAERQVTRRIFQLVWSWDEELRYPRGRLRDGRIETHQCGKRRRGRPRVGYGACQPGRGDRARVYDQRVEVLELRRAVLRGEDPWSDLVALLSSRVPISRR